MPLFPHVLTSVLALTRFQGIFARYNGFRHEAVDASKQRPEKRAEPLFIQNSTITEQCSAATPIRTIHSLVYPSPNASAVEITAQSQVVTSFFPEMTWCVGSPMGLAPISGPPYMNKTTEYETVIAGTGYCETVYVPTTTAICATTITGIASKVTVSKCDQEVTFSSECGYELETPTPTATGNFSSITPAPTVQRLMTYWLAPWQSLTAGESPSDVDIKVCKVLDDDEMECTRYQEVWEVVTVTQTSISSHEVALTTTLSGPGTLIVETMEIYVTDTIETVDLSTTLLMKTEVEIESTSKAKKLVTRPETDVKPQSSTLYITKHVKYKNSQHEPTTTVRITSVATQHVGTVTKISARPQPTLLEMPEG